MWTYVDLQKIINDTNRKIAKDEDIHPAQLALTVAAAFACDFMEIGRRHGHDLDMTIMQEDEVMSCLMAAFFSYANNGMTIEESRVTLAKMLGAYELFAILNTVESIDSEEPPAKLTIMQIMEYPWFKPVIETSPDEDGKTFCFDVYETAEETVSSFDLNNGDDGPTFMGSIKLFHDRLRDELLTKISEQG